MVHGTPGWLVVGPGFSPGPPEPSLCSSLAIALDLHKPVPRGAGLALSVAALGIQRRRGLLPGLLNTVYLSKGWRWARHFRKVIDFQSDAGNGV